MDLLQPEVEPARVGDLQGRVAEVGPFCEQQAHRLGGLQPSFGVGAGDVVRRDRHDPTHALERVGQERVLGHEVADGIGGDGADAHPLGEAEHRTDLRVRSPFHPVLGRDEEPFAAERFMERMERRGGGVDEAADGEPARVRTRAGERDETGGVGADLGRGDRGIPALPQHVRVGDQSAEVGVAPPVLREQDERGVVSTLPDRERGAEDRTDPSPLAGGDEPGGAVEPVPVGERHGRHPHLARERGEMLGDERPLLQRERGPDVEMDESPRAPHSIEHMFDTRWLLSRLSRGSYGCSIVCDTRQEALRGALRWMTSR